MHSHICRHLIPSDNVYVPLHASIAGKVRGPCPRICESAKSQCKRIRVKCVMHSRGSTRPCYFKFTPILKCSEHGKDRATNVCVCLMRATALATLTACMGIGSELVQWSMMALAKYAWLCRCGYTMSTYQSNHGNVVQEDKGSFNIGSYLRKLDIG